MAIVRKSGGESASSPGVPTPKLTLSLPTEKSSPQDNLGDYTWLIYGEKKIGKTSLAAQFPDALFMMFEPGGKGLSIYQKPLTSWAEFKEYVNLLRADPSERFKTVVIDTVDIAYDQCMEYVGKRSGFSHPGEMNDFGKSWQMVSREFTKVINDLVHTGRGVMFLSHAKESEFQEATGAKHNKIIPTMSNQARNFVTGFVDVIAYYGYYGSERLLTIRGSDTVDAGHRVDGKFLVQDSDERVFSIPMGNSPSEGYSNIQTAFDNLQQTSYKPQSDTLLSGSTAKRQGARK